MIPHIVLDTLKGIHVNTLHLSNDIPTSNLTDYLKPGFKSFKNEYS